MSTQDQAPYDVEADAHLVQQGKATRPGFFSDHQQSQIFNAFILGVNTALSYSGNTSTKDELVDSRSDDDYDQPYRLTKSEFAVLQKRATSISNYAKIPYDTVEDFLIIICFVDNLDDMKKIADCVQIPELYNPNILRQPMMILNLRGLENIAFAAQALDGLIHMFRKYLVTSQNISNTSNDEGSSSILSSLSSIVGGLGGFQQMIGIRLDNADIGSFLTETITGKKIPTNVIAKNPMMQSPSYVGKAFFGESPNPLPNIDIDQLFNKPIGVFPKPSNGSGTSSFSMQNFGSFSRQMSLSNLVAKFVTGSSTLERGTRKYNQIMPIVDKINTFTGSRSDETIDIQRADNAIPMMMAMSSVYSGLDKLVFSSKSFTNGWSCAQSAAQQCCNNNPGFLEAARQFL